MLVGRKRTSSSFAPDGKRLQCSAVVRTACQPTSCHSSDKLFRAGVKLVVQRAPVISGLSIPAGLQKKFQRPMIKRRAYNRNADEALKNSSLGQRRRMDGMSRLMARAGRGLTFKLPQRGLSEVASDEESEEDNEKENERPFEPLLLWTSPREGGEPIGLPPRTVTEMQPDECGVEELVTVLRPAPIEAYAKTNVFVPSVLAKWLRPHQREGVQFMYECVMGLKNFEGNGCILADDMGLGKTLQSVSLIYTLLKTSITANGEPTAKRVIVVCPCSLVKNWENEFVKWLGTGAVKTMALAESDRKTVEKNLDLFIRTKMFNILIVSYETIRTHIGRLNKHKECCDLLVCDEAHRLKNSENQTSMALASLPVKRRVLLTGTPMQNDLQEFFAMVDFTNPGVLGTQEEFRKKMLFPILRGREPDATESQKRKMMDIQNDMSKTVNEFILRRINTLNAQHLPPKLVQVVCCKLTEIQQNMYQHLVTSKDMQHVLNGKQVNCLGSIQMLMKLCNHPRLVAEEEGGASNKPGRRAATKTTKYTDGEDTAAAAPGADGISKFLPYEAGCGRGTNAPVRPEWSGKMFVLYRLMKEMRKPGNGNDKIVIVSNYTQTLDLIGRMCRENSWGFCRLDGSISMKKRQKMVDEFNDPSTPLIAFLLSSKAGGCGLNLIGGNRLVLFDPDWNPAVDKQAAARCWRDGQKKRCFTYRFLATGTVEEKIFQRQLSKEGLQSVVDDKEQVNALSTKDLRNLFKLRSGTPSDTHDKLRCERCKIIADHAETEAAKVLPKKLAACRELLTRIEQHEDAAMFLKPLVPQDHGVSKEEYEKAVKQPIDLGSIRTKLDLSVDHPASYKSVSGFSKDVNRIFANIMKVWSPGQDIADAARRLQAWWVDEWTGLVPILMTMKADNDEVVKNEGEDLVDPTSTSPSNERGEDFQEQIGMPDEENMRSWSHHYDTDTVDDPVFRAAMRGCDAVSFVFGLEVTWSLIQERQQDEEEREAMKELAALQELEEVLKGEAKESFLGDGGSVDGGAASSCKVDDAEHGIEVTTSPPVVKMDDNDEDALELDDNEDEGGEETSPIKTENEDSSQYGYARSCKLDDTEEETEEETSPERFEESDDEVMSTRRSQSRTYEAASPETPEGRSSAETKSSQSDDNIAQGGSDSPSPSAGSTQSDGSIGPKQTKSPAQQSSRGLGREKDTQASQSLRTLSVSNEEWACGACTLVNKKNSRKCTVCGTKRPPQARKRTIDEMSY